MDKRRVGQTKLEIDSLGLGGAPLGGNFVDLGYAQAEELIQAAKNIGIGYFDTAPWYGFGRSERVMGDVLRGSESSYLIKLGACLRPVQSKIQRISAWLTLCRSMLFTIIVMTGSCAHMKIVYKG